MSRVFVYGTLKKDFVNEHLLADQTFLGKAVTQDGNMLLYETTGYSYPFPALVKRQDAGDVYGELYEVSERCLSYLDRLEGTNANPPLYTRETTTVRTVDGNVYHDVFVYVFARDISDLRLSGACWPGKEIDRWHSVGKRVREVTNDEETQGVRLWNKREEKWQSPCMADESQLQRWALSRSKSLGGNGVDMLWSPNYFEPRPDNYLCSVTKFQLWDTEKLEALSPEFPNFRELVGWCENNATLFNGEAVSADTWAKIFKSFD